MTRRTLLFFLVVAILNFASCQKTFDALLRDESPFEFVENYRREPENLQFFAKNEGEKIVLENSKVRFDFASKEFGFGIVQIVDKTRNYSHLKKTPNLSILWSADWRDEEGLGYTVDNSFPSNKGHSVFVDPNGSTIITFTWSNITFGLYDAPTFSTVIKVKVTLPKDSGLAQFSLEVDNQKKKENQPCLWAIRTPRVSFLGSSVDDSHDSIVLPTGLGLLYKPSDVQGGWSKPYPSSGSTFQYLSFCNSNASSCIYYGAHDGNGHSKNFQFSHDGSGSTIYTTQTPPDSCMKRDGKLQEIYKTPWDTVIGVHPGDHWDSSTIYRDFVMKNAVWTKKGPMKERKDVPEWYKNVTLWFNTGWNGGVLNASEGNPSVAVPKLLNLRKIVGAPFTVHYYCWHRFPFDSNYPDYFPAKAGWLEGVQKLEAAGIHVVPYINGRIWDYNSPSFIPENAMNHIAKNSAPRFNPSTLQPYNENYGSGQNFAIGCPGDNYWPKKISSVAKTLFETYKTSGVYIDQIASAAPVLCSDPSHGHSLRGGNYFTKGDNLLLGSALSSANNHNGIIVTEDNAETYMASLSGYLSLVGYGSCNLFPAFPSIYGGYMHTFGRYFVNLDYTDPSFFDVKMAQMFVYGSQMGWAGVGGQNPMYPFLTNPNNSKSVSFLRTLMEYRVLGGDHLKDGRLYRPLIVQGDKPTIDSDCKREALQHSVWIHNSTVGIFFVNAQDSKHQSNVAIFNASGYGLDVGRKLKLVQKSSNGSKLIKIFGGNETLSIKLEIPARTVEYYIVSYAK